MKVLHVDIAGTALYWIVRQHVAPALTGVVRHGTLLRLLLVNARSMPNGMARAMDATRLPVPSAPSATLGA